MYELDYEQLAKAISVVVGSREDHALTEYELHPRDLIDRIEKLIDEMVNVEDGQRLVPVLDLGSVATAVIGAKFLGPLSMFVPIANTEVEFASFVVGYIAAKEGWIEHAPTS